MADLIDRDALLKDMGLTDAVKYGNKNSKQQERSYSTWMSYEIADSIWDAPAIDAVPVVRCGECKHMMPNGYCEEFADRGIRPSVSDFCSYGQRRDEDAVQSPD